MNTETFTSPPAFCPDCGSILPLLQSMGDIICYRCLKHFGTDANVIGDGKVKYTINFNSLEAYALNVQEEKRKRNESETDEGPIVERKCPKCGHDKMSYATLQLRSADEGQTVFYTCTKCKFKENENS